MISVLASRKNKKKSKIPYVLIMIIAILFMFCGGYYYATSGEKLSNEKIGWILDSPIAHRGLFNDEYPENSMGALKNAVDNGYMIELDLILSKDKEIVVFHDENLERMTGDSRDIQDVNYNELTNLKLGNSDETIPLFKDVLATINGQVPLFIEIKNCENVTELCEKAYELLKDYNGKFTIHSFNPFALQWFSNNAPEIIRGVLTGSLEEGGENLKSYEKFVLKNMLLNFLAKPNYIGYELKMLPKFRVSQLRNSGIPVLTFTITNNSEAKTANKYSDNYVFENFIPNEK